MSLRKKKHSGKERRKFPRLRAASVEYSPVKKKSLEKTVFARDLGLNGICIVVSEKLKINTILSLKIYLPDRNTPIEVKGKVVRVSESSFLSSDRRKHYDLGIEFVEIDQKDWQRIYQYSLKLS